MTLSGHAFAGEFDGVRVTQLMRDEAATDAGVGGSPPQHGASGGR